MRIGIDLDDVVFDFTNFILINYEKEFGKKLHFEEVVSFYFEDILNLSREKVNLFFKEILTKDSVINMNLCKFAKEMILELSQYNEIFFITSRVHAREGTLDSLKKHFSDINFELIFSSNPYHQNCGKTKGEICKELGINLIIEDDVKHCEECIQKGIKVLLLDKPWNRNFINHPHVIRVKNWKEILDIFENKEIVERVKEFVKGECVKHVLGNEIYNNHFISVVNYSKKLAKELNVDKEVLEIASWLHDIGSIKYGRENHHITGAEIAEEKLKEFNYPQEKIEFVKNCILNHRGSIKNDLLTCEEKILVEADCLSCFDNLEGQFLWVIDGDKIKNQKQIREIVLRKIQNKWDQLSEKGKKLVRDKYEAAVLLLS